MSIASFIVAQFPYINCQQSQQYIIIQLKMSAYTQCVRTEGEGEGSKENKKRKKIMVASAQSNVVAFFAFHSRKLCCVHIFMCCIKMYFVSVMTEYFSLFFASPFSHFFILLRLYLFVLYKAKKKIYLRLKGSVTELCIIQREFICSQKPELA